MITAASQSAGPACTTNQSQQSASGLITVK